ncbi:hypothetical protein ABKN59_004323 [Abortiporus biennis]
MSETQAQNEIIQKLNESEAYDRCRREARRDGIFAGMSAGLVGAIIGSRFFKFNRNTTLVCGVVTGVLAGYQFTQGFLSTNLARLQHEQQAMLQTSNPSEEQAS